MLKKLLSLAIVLAVVLCFADTVSAGIKSSWQWGTFVSGIPNNISSVFGNDPQSTRIISWQTGEDTLYGEVVVDNTVYPAVRTVIGNRAFFRVDLTDLNPDTTYTYYCGAYGSYSREYTFTTAPSDFVPFTILHVTDPHMGYGNYASDGAVWRRVAEAGINTVPNPAFIVNTGDLTEKASEAQLQYYFDYAQDIIANNAFVYSLGNNDSSSWYNSYFPLPSKGTQNFSFHYGNALFINIHYPDDYSYLTPSVLNWLEYTLMYSNKKWKIVMLHTSPYCRSSPSNTQEQALANLFDTYNVNFVLGGHNHFYGRTHPINRYGSRVGKGFGTVYTIPNTAGYKYNAYSVHARFAVSTQPYLPMFTSLTFTENNIELNAYTVAINGAVTLHDTYFLFEPSAEGVVIASLTQTAREPSNLTPRAMQGVHGNYSNLTAWSNNVQIPLGRDSNTPVTIANQAVSGGWLSVGRGVALDNAVAFQFKLRTAGFENIRFTAKQKSTGSGPDFFSLAYSTSPTGPFIPIPDSKTTNRQASSAFRTDTYFDFEWYDAVSYDNFRLPAAMENQEEIYLRVYLSTENYIATGNGNTSINDIVFIGDEIRITPRAAAPTANTSETSLLLIYSDMVELQTAMPNSSIRYEIYDTGGAVLKSEALYSAPFNPFYGINTDTNPTVTVKAWVESDGFEPSDPLTIKYVWAYKVIFDENGGEHNGGGALEQKVPQGGTATAPEVSRNGGWIFNGWDGGTLTDITSGITLTADWLRIGAITTDGRGHVTSEDLTWLARHIAGHSGFDISNQRIANLRGDDRPPELNDVTMLARWLLGYDWEYLIS
jgi:predicted phosphodiesterase